MKIKPIILCGGAGTRLFPPSFKSNPKQFIDFGGWTLFEKTLERIKDSIYDFPVISSNIKYEKIIKKFLKLYKIDKGKKEFKNAELIQKLGFLIGLHTKKIEKKRLQFLHDNLFMIDKF